MFTTLWNNVSKPKFRICFIAALWGFLTGLERAVIIPTLWLYFSKAFSKSTASHYYAWTLAAFNVAILVCDPLFGYLAFVRVRVKTLLVISNQLGIIGNIIYFMASHPWMILFGRFLAGAGAGCEVPLYADIVRITTTQERTPYIVTLLLFRQFGLIIGPACTLIMKEIKFKIGQVTFDVFNGPGLLLAILWSIHTVFVFAIYPQISSEKRPLVKRDVTPLVCATPSDLDGSNRMSYCSDIIDSSPDIEETNETATEKISNFFNPKNYQEYGTYKIFTILFITFSSYFSLMGLESVLPPMASRYFNWSEVETSYVYLGCGLSVVVVYLILRLISSYGVQDRHLLLGGLFFLVVSYLWLSISLSLIEKSKPTLYITLIIIGIGFHVIGQPFCVSCSESLYTKYVSVTDQDRAQSILRMVINVALLIGPFVGGSMESEAFVVFILLLIAVAVPFLLLILRYQTFSLDVEIYVE